MAKKTNYGMISGALTFLGSLIYLAAVFSWYAGGAMPGGWLAYAQFLAPFVMAFAIIGSISLFFLSIGIMAGKFGGDNEKMMKTLWKFVICTGATLLIITAGAQWFYITVVGFLLTYIGVMTAKM